MNHESFETELTDCRCNAREIRRTHFYRLPPKIARGSLGAFVFFSVTWSRRRVILAPGASRVQSSVYWVKNISAQRKMKLNAWGERKVIAGPDDKRTYRDISIKVKLDRLLLSTDLRLAIEDGAYRDRDIAARDLLLASHTAARDKMIILGAALAVTRK